MMITHVVLLFPLCGSLCEQYDTIATKVYEDPRTTEEMVELERFLTTVSTPCT